MAFLRKEGKYVDAPRPDLILLDLNLPRKDGREVLAEIKADADLKRIPVVILTVSQRRGGHPQDVQPARQLLHHQADRSEPVHEGRPVDRGLLADDRQAAQRREVIVGVGEMGWLGPFTFFWSKITPATRA